MAQPVGSTVLLSVVPLLVDLGCNSKYALGHVHPQGLPCSQSWLGTRFTSGAETQLALALALIELPKVRVTVALQRSLTADIVERLTTVISHGDPSAPPIPPWTLSVTE